MVDSPLASVPVEQTIDGQFVSPDSHAEVAVVVVTYNSAHDLARLIASLRLESGAQRLRVIVSDNASGDDTLAVARTHDDIIVVETGGNLGYAGGINVALQHVGDADTILVLNPDLIVEPGGIAALRARLKSSNAGVVVPKYLEDDVVFTSLRREPSVLRALGDSVFGERFAQRAGALSEWVLDRREYTTPHEIEWATGAALLIDADVARAVGDWDERFFLYSEETDFFRRVRELGYSVWYEPTAVVRHQRGGSGRSIELDKLVTVNRVRYFRKHHGRAASALFRAVTVMHQLVRVYSAVYRPLLFSVANESSWSSLPKAQRIPATEVIAQVRGTIVIDARHFADDKAAYTTAVARTVHALATFAANPLVTMVIARADGLRAITQPGGTPGATDATALDRPSPVDLAQPTLIVEAGLEPDAASVVDTLSASEVTGTPVAPPHEWSLDDARPLVRLFARLAPRSVSAGPAAPRVYCGSASTAPEDSPQEFDPVDTNPIRVPVPPSISRLRQESRRMTGTTVSDTPLPRAGSGMRRRVLLIAPAADGEDISEAWNAYQWVRLLADETDLTVLTSWKRGHTPLSRQLPHVRIIEWSEAPLVGRVERLNSLMQPGYPLFYWRARRWIKQRMAAGERFDVAAQVIPVAMRYASPAAGLGIPLVVGPVGGSLTSPPAFVAEEGASPWYQRLRALDKFRLTHDRPLRRTYESASCIIGIAPYVKEFLDGLDLRRFEVMSEVALLDLPDVPQRLDIGGPVRLLHVGRTIRTKGLRDVIRAMALLRDLDVVLDVLGDGSDRAECEGLVRKLGLEDRVTFHGMVPRATVREFYARADVFVFPSYREPGGGVILEALSYGLPLVLTDRGGPASFVDDTCAYRIPAVSPDQLSADCAAAVRELVVDTDRRARMSAAARELAASTHLWTHRVDQMLSLFDELSPAHHPPRGTR